MCRLVVIGPTSRVELAVPSHIPVAELLPTIVGHLDPTLATRGLSHGGWVLQRLGHAPLDENRSTSAAGLLDGDVLYLKARGDEMAEAQYDDLVDGVQTILRAHGDEWTPERTRTAALVSVAIACLGVTAMAVTMGPFAPIATFALAAILVGAGAFVGRLWDAAAGEILLLGAVVAAGAAGVTLPNALFPQASDGLLVQVVTAAVAVGVIAAAGAYARGGVRPVLLAIIGASIVVVCTLIAPLLLGLTPQSGAALVVLVLLVIARVIPMLSAWIAGLEIDPVPTSAEEFQSDLNTITTSDIADKTERARAVAAALWVAWATVLCVANSVLGVSEGWAPMTLAFAVCIATLLQARELLAVVHRTALLIAAVLPLIPLALVQSQRLAIPWQFVVLAALAISVAYLVIAVRILPGRRLAPTWGRLGDNLHMLCAIAVPALALAVMGVYSWIADLF